MIVLTDWINGIEIPQASIPEKTPIKCPNKDKRGSRAEDDKIDKIRALNIFQSCPRKLKIIHVTKPNKIPEKPMLQCIRKYEFIIHSIVVWKRMRNPNKIK